MVDILKDISTMTAIPMEQFIKLTKDMELSIEYAVKEAYINADKKDTVVDLDIGIGRLILAIKNKEIHYKFVPSQSLHRGLQKIDSPDSFTGELEEKIRTKFIRAYKELM